MSIIPRITVFTLAILAVLLAHHQVLRQDANDPQIQMSEDIAAALSAGAPLTSLQLPPAIDMETSLAPFVQIYDAQRNLVLSTGKIGDVAPVIPSGVFSATKPTQENRLTWQPQSNVREAIVVHTYQNGNQFGFVVAGRSLREVERRKDQLMWSLFIGWILGIVALFVVEIFTRAQAASKR